VKNSAPDLLSVKLNRLVERWMGDAARPRFDGWKPGRRSLSHPDYWTICFQACPGTGSPRPTDGAAQDGFDSSCYRTHRARVGLTSKWVLVEPLGLGELSMLARKQVARGFTLVEILIVVVILGILAAIVIPQFTSASESAKSSSLTSQLQTIRSQLELYQVQHNGNYPTLIQLNADWGVMTSETDVDSTIGVGDDFPFGPYLQQPPANPFITSVGDVNIDLVDIGAADAFAEVGWGYDEDNGTIKAMVPDTVDVSALGIEAGVDFILEDEG
jgi:general secretion pathway protein G